MTAVALLVERVLEEARLTGERVVPDHRNVVVLVRRVAADALAAEQRPARALLVRAGRDARTGLAETVDVLRVVALADRALARLVDRAVVLRDRERNLGR